MPICNGRTIRFHIAITSTIENAKAVCSQAVMYRSTDNNPLLYFAVYHRHTPMLYFCQLDPEQQTCEDVAHFRCHVKKGT